ncbi:MAG: MurR/RpiR family transcriptional regulator [Spirochaetaceae bacterium]|nr:MurR/RpiR family transcriptional regulator [Spirochaetaceae bacterium]
MAVDTDWARRLSKASGTFTKSEKEIADYIRQFPHEAAFLSLKELCRKKGISKPTAIEFYKKLEYSNYQDFRAGMMSFYEHHIDSYKASSRIFNKISSFSELISAAIETDIKALNLFARQFSENELKHAAEKILKANTVYLLGPGTGFYPAHYLYQRLKRYKLNVQLVAENSTNVVDLLFPASAKDLLITFMYMNDTKSVIKILNSVKDSGIGIITVTGTVDPGLSEASDKMFYVNRGDIEFKNSMAVPMNFANLLLLAVELAGGETLKENLKKLEDRRNEFSKC